MLALISQTALNFQSCCKVASCRKGAREPPPSSGACKQLWNSSYAAVLGQEPGLRHTFQRGKKTHSAVEMMSIWHPFLLLPSLTQPSQQLPQELQQWLPRDLGVAHLLEALSSSKRHTFLGRGQSIQHNCHKETSHPLVLPPRGVSLSWKQISACFNQLL